MIEMIKGCQKSGDKIILWTCRTDDQLQEAVKWCASLNLFFDAINENIPEVQKQWGGDTRKVYADIYIDDKMRFPVW